MWLFSAVDFQNSSGSFPICVTNDTILRGPRRFLVATPSRHQTLPANSTWREARHL